MPPTDENFTRPEAETAATETPSPLLSLLPKERSNDCDDYITSTCKQQQQQKPTYQQQPHLVSTNTVNLIDASNGVPLLAMAMSQRDESIQVIPTPTPANADFSASPLSPLAIAVSHDDHHLVLSYDSEAMLPSPPKLVKHETIHKQSKKRPQPQHDGNISFIADGSVKSKEKTKAKLLSYLQSVDRIAISKQIQNRPFFVNEPASAYKTVTSSDSLSTSLVFDINHEISNRKIEGSQSQRTNDPFYLPLDKMVDIGLTAMKTSFIPFLSRDSMKLTLTPPSNFAYLLESACPENGVQDYSQLLDELESVFAAINREDHPGFLGYTQSYPNFISCMGKLLIGAFNPTIPVDWTAPGFNAIQRTVVKWLCQTVGYDCQTMGGHCVSGGTEANELCLAAAVARFESQNSHTNRLELRQKAVIYASKASHHCVLAAANVLGFDVASQFALLPVLGPKDHFKIDLDALKKQIKADRAAGKIPIFLAACAGSTMLAAYDDFEELASVCQPEGIWLHGDGAWGGASLLIDAGKLCLRGSELTDSFVIDPHKGLYEPYGLGVAVMKDQEYLRKFFAPLSFKHPDVAQFLDKDSSSTTSFDVHHMKDYGRQLSQPCKVLGLYMALKYYGLATYRKAVQLGWEQANTIANLFREKENWRVIIEPRFSMVTVQYAPLWLDQETINDVNREIVKNICSEGIIYPNTNYFHDDQGIGQAGIRLVCMNPMSDDYPHKIIETFDAAVQYIIQMKNLNKDSRRDEIGTSFGLLKKLAVE